MEKPIWGVQNLIPKLETYKVDKRKGDFTIPREEQCFEKLINQKNNEKNESDQKVDTRDDEVKIENREETESNGASSAGEKTESESENELNYDVAREAACAQIVWMMPQVTAEEQVEIQTVTGEVAEIGEMANVLAEAGEDIVIPEELQLVETGETVVQETVVMAETGLAPEQTVEAAEEVMTGETEIEVQSKNGEIEVSEASETDETGGEAVVAEAPLFKDVEAAPIKVAEAPAQAEIPEVEKQVSDKLVQILESNENRVEIQLQPEALGKLTIELNQNADGTLNIILNAESAQTRGMLEKTISTLHEALLDRGQQNVQIEINRGEEAQHQPNQQQDLQNGRNGNHGEQQRRRQESSGEDFLQQLRLGLIDLQEES